MNEDTPGMVLDLDDPPSSYNSLGKITTAGAEEGSTCGGAEKEAGAEQGVPGAGVADNGAAVGLEGSSAPLALCLSSGNLSNEVADPHLNPNPLVWKDLSGGYICQDPSVDTTGWKRRKRAVDGPDCRLCPSHMSAIDKCLLNAKDRARPEIFAPVEGTTFDSCQEAYELYNLFSWECGFGIKHAKTRLNGKGYRSMHELVCQCYGKSDKENSATTKTGCKAMIRLLRTDDHGWYVSMFVNDHNHPLSEKCVEKRQWKSHNCIDPMTKAFIRNLRENNVSLGKIYNILCGVNSEPGVAPYRKETLKYLCSRMSQESAKKDVSDTICLLQDMRAADGNLVVSINVDKEGSVKSILWCTGKNREDYAHFGDVVTFDTTYRTNLYNMPFGLFVGVNNHFQSTIFGGVLLRQETIPDFEWAFKTFVETMNGKHPQTMLTDQCKAMEGAIKNVLPHTRHRWCKWHVVKCAKEKLGFVYSKNSSFKHEFHSLINDVMDVKEFEKKWEMLIDKHNLSTNAYLGNMYANREKWAKPYFTGVFCAGMTSTQRSESANHMLKKYIPRSSPMHLFVKQYNNLLRSRITDEGKEDFVTKMKRRVIKGGNPIEADASQIYTNAVYQRFEQELYLASSLIVSGLPRDNVFHVTKARYDTMPDFETRAFEVCIKDEGQFVTCDCGMFDHVGMLCCHSIKVLLRNDTLKIPTKNIMKRWTKWAKEAYPEHLPLVPIRPTEDEYSQRRNVLYIAATELLNDRSVVMNLFDKTLHMFRGLKNEGMVLKELELEKLDQAHDDEDTGMEGFSITCYEDLRPPKKVKSKGRPPTVRPKSRMDYVKKFMQKTKPVKCLYTEGDIPLDGLGSVGGREPCRKVITCSVCKVTGHNKTTCKARGF